MGLSLTLQDLLWKRNLHVSSPATWLVLPGKELIKLMSIGFIYFRRYNYKFSTAGQRLAHLGTGNGVSELSVGYQNPPRSWGIWGLLAWADIQLSAGWPCYTQQLCVQFSPSTECRLAHIKDEGGQLCPCGEPPRCLGKVVEWGKYIQHDSSRTS